MTLRTNLDVGKHLGMPDGVLINAKGPYRYNITLVPDGIDFETINVDLDLQLAMSISLKQIESVNGGHRNGAVAEKIVMSYYIWHNVTESSRITTRFVVRLCAKSREAVSSPVEHLTDHYQVLIDESTQATEPECLIPLVLGVKQDLSDNLLYEDIPFSISKLKQLELLNLKNNQLTVEDLACNQLIGEIPRLIYWNETSASLKFTVLNPEGRIWTMVAGGGASVIYADTVGDLGYASELGNYAEYSGAPNEEEVLQYARVVIDCATANPDGRKRVLLIGGGIANFTDESKLKAARMHIYVRRGGPNYQTGLAKMRALGEELGVPLEVFGPEATMTGICKQAIECIMSEA
ncbi:unnamed protein product [Camellia sinensis]